MKMLSSHRLGLPLRQLGKELGVSIKTVRRDLDVLRSVGFPISEMNGEFGRKAWRIEGKWSGPDATFTFDEALALHLGRRLMEPLKGTMIWEASQRAFQKIRATLGGSVLQYLDKMGEAFYQTKLGGSDFSRHSAIIDQLLIGIEDRRATFITYQSQQATEPVTYDIFPYGISNHRGALYLVGFAPRHDDLRHWKVNRIEAVDVTEVRFHRPDDFDMRKHFAGSFGVFQGNGDVRVVIRFAREVSRYVSEAQWHPSQELHPQRDGSVLAAFRLTATAEIKSWILSFGRHAEALEPIDLRTEIADELRLLDTRYRLPDDLNSREIGRRKSKRSQSKESHL